jgi:hypothetical protein
MEAAGVASATYESVKKPGFFMVRGVSDLADEMKNSRQAQKWRPYACAIAAAYTVALLQSGPVPLVEPVAPDVALTDKAHAYAELSLKIFRMDNRQFEDEIVFEQTREPSNLSPNDFRFGLALENHAPAGIACNIDIRVEFSWRGGVPQYPLHFAVHQWTREAGWRADCNDLTPDRPAVLVFRGTERDRCSLDQPLQWHNFTLSLKEKLKGYILINYRVSSLQPESQRAGELRIVMK